MCAKKSSSTQSTSEPFLPQLVQRKDLLGILNKVYLTVGDDKSRVDAYKCFRFEDGSVASFDGDHGILASCPVNVTCSVFATRLLTYLKALDADEVRIGMHDGKLRVNDVHFPVLADNDFPDLSNFIGENAECVRAEPGFGAALKEIMFCLDRASSRQNLPPAVQIKNGRMYASDNTHAARHDLKIGGEALVPLNACKHIVKLGDPDEVHLTDRSIVCYYGDTCFVARLLQGPSIAKAIDEKLALMKAREALRGPPDYMIPVLKRFKALAGDDTVSVVWNPAVKMWALSVENKAEGISAQEFIEHQQELKGLGFRVGLIPLLEALEAEPAFFDVSDLLHLSPRALRFIHPSFEHLVALRSQ